MLFHLGTLGFAKRDEFPEPLTTPLSLVSEILVFDVCTFHVRFVTVSEFS